MRAAPAACALLALAACTSTVTPPPDPAAPTTVYLLREAMHTGLVLPPEGTGDEYVEFGFGQWSWFALGNDSWYHAFGILWPRQGTLGRRTFHAADGTELARRVYWAELSPLVVAGARVHALHTRLQHEHDDALANAIAQPAYGWTFIPYDRSYWLAQTCADIAAEWLTELDCAVGWAPIRTGLAIAK